jgi:hypothetical protein
MKDYDNGQNKDKNHGDSEKSNTMVVGADTRNMAWRKSNVGSKLLSKMGWSDGQAVGKRQRRSTVVASNDDANPNDDTTMMTTSKSNINTACISNSSSEGLRVMKRQDGLGIGATAASSAYSNASNAVQHVQDYVDVLALLQQAKPKSQADNQDKAEKKRKKKEKKKRKRSKEESLTNIETTTHTTNTNLLSKSISSNNTMTNPKVRKAKFQQKTNDDYKGIFGSFHSDDIIKSTTK